MSMKWDIEDRPHSQERIGALWAVVDGNKGGEGIVGAELTPHLYVALVSGDESLMRRVMLPVARELAKGLGRPLKLVKFTTREDVEAIEP